MLFRGSPRVCYHKLGGDLVSPYSDAGIQYLRKTKIPVPKSMQERLSDTRIRVGFNQAKHAVYLTLVKQGSRFNEIFSSLQIPDEMVKNSTQCADFAREIAQNTDTITNNLKEFIDHGGVLVGKITYKTDAKPQKRRSQRQIKGGGW